MHRSHIFIFLLCLCHHIGTGQNEIRVIERYGINEGLSYTHINSVIQDKRGYLWIGTEWGLNRYDGINFKKYITPGKDALPDLDIRNLTEDPTGKLWMSAGESAVCSFDPFTDKFITYPVPAKTVVYFDKQKHQWRGSKYGVDEFDSSNKLIQHINVYLGDEQTNRYISDFLEDDKGRLWLATSDGVKLFNRSSRSFSSTRVNNIAPALRMPATKLYQDSKGNIYAGTWNEGLLKWNESGTCFDRISLKNILNDQQSVFHVCEININGKSKLLLGSLNGLILADPQKINNNVLEPDQFLNDEKEQLANSYISNIYKDRQDIFWISASSGLYKIDPARQNLQWIKVEKDQAIFHVINDIKDPGQKVYLTSFKGWSKLDLNTGALEKWKLPFNGNDLLSNINNYVLTDSGYWFTSQKGFGFYDIELNRITDHTKLLSGNTERTGVIFADEQRRIWFSNFKNGLCIFDPFTKKITRILNNPSNEPTLYGNYIFGALLHKGYVWISGDNHLFKIDPLTLQYKTYPLTNLPQGLHGIASLFTDGKRLLIYGSQEVYEFKNGRFLPVYTESQRTGLYIHDIMADPSGDVWILTVNGLYKVTADLKQWILYSSKTGINSTLQVTEMHVMNNKLVVATNTGKVLLYELNNDQQKVTAINITISSVKDGNNKTHAFPALLNTAITVPYKQSIELELGFPNFSNEKENSIYYQLQGWDNEWKEVIGGKVRFEGLPPGKYILKMNASSSVSNKVSETIFHFNVDYPFWQTWWFITLSAILVFAAFYIVYRYRLQQVINMERLRTRIATDLHDDIGATLSSISMYSESVKSQVKDKIPHLQPVLEKMGENSRNMVSSMSDIVWAVNPENDQGEKLLQRIEAYAKDNCSIKDVQLFFHYDSELAATSFSLTHRKNIYLIFKEALNNALKYSNATTIWVSMEKQGPCICLIIKDNGKGFDTSVPFTGNGIRNLYSRAKEINAVLQINAVPQPGTVIYLKCKIS